MVSCIMGNTRNCEINSVRSNETVLRIMSITVHSYRSIWSNHLNYGLNVFLQPKTLHGRKRNGRRPLNCIFSHELQLPPFSAATPEIKQAMVCKPSIHREPMTMPLVKYILSSANSNTVKLLFCVHNCLRSVPRNNQPILH